MSEVGITGPDPGPAIDARIPSPLQAILMWVTSAIAVVGAGFVVAALLATVTAARGQDPRKVLGDISASPLINDPTWIALGTLANELAVVLAVIVWLKLLRTPRSVLLPMARPSVIGVVGALLVVFGLAPIAEIAGELIRRWLDPDVTAARLVVNAAKNASPVGMVLLLFGLAVMPALAEEALFRGLLTAPFERRFVLALIVPSILFGLFHLEPTQVAGTIILGIGFALARLCTGTLVTGIIAHFVYNAAVIITVRYTDVPEHHEISVVPVLGGLVLSVAGGVVLFRERRMNRPGVSVEASRPSWWL
jgi:membrane protease YdiL (CAAX protease family)